MKLYRHWAVEPAAIGQFDRFRYLFEKLGFARGQLCVRVPQGWELEVLGQYSDQIDRRRVEAAFQRYSKFRLVDAPKLGNERCRDWLAKVEAVHRRTPLDGVISKNPIAPSAPDLTTSCIDACDEEFFGEMHEARIPRTAKALAAVARDLIAVSPRVVVVDPYFNPMSEKYLSTLAEICRTARQENCSYVDVVTHHDWLPKNPEGDLQKKLVKKIFAEKSKPNLTIKFVIPPTPGDFHHRFLLSEAGGIRYDAGFADEGESQGNDVVLVDERRHKQLIAQYFAESGGFDLAYLWSWPRTPSGFRMA